MIRFTDKQKLALIAWCDPALQRHSPPYYHTVARFAGLAGKQSVPRVLATLRDHGYLDANMQPTDRGRRTARRLAREVLGSSKLASKRKEATRA